MNILHPWLDWCERNTGNDDGIQFEQNDPALINSRGPGPNTTGLLETLFIYIFSRLAQASVQALYNLSSSPVVLGPGFK